MAKKSDVPVGLGDIGAVLWVETLKSFDLRADEKVLLEQACREADLIAALDDELRFASFVVSGSQGQQVANPLLAEIRQHRSTYAALMARLKLSDVDDAKPSGLKAVPNQARDAAKSRWATAYGKEA